MNEHGYQRCTKCGELLPVDEPQDEAPDELPIDPVPFSLTSGHDVTGTNYDANKAVMDAIKQYGPKTWSPFGR